MLHYDLVNNCEAKAGTLVLRREEGIENVIELLLRHADASVTDFELTSPTATSLHRTGRDSYHTARFRCLHGIEDKVDHDLFDLIVVRLYR